MISWRRVFTGFLNDSYGAAASAMLLLCMLSGVLLVPFYDSNDAYHSISAILLFNPWASFFRDAHFWSAQFFFVLSIVHLWGYLRPRNYKSQRQAVWLRLGMALPLLFYVMFSGFLLKGDEDSTHAAGIFRELLMVIPLFGESLSAFILGKSNSLALSYVHHIATATIILIIIIREHARKLWVGLPTFLYAAIITILLALLFGAPLHDSISPLVKGPWYFLGVQELLHWMPFPSTVWYLLLLFLASFISMYYVKAFYQNLLRRSMLLLALVFLIATVVGVFFRGEEWSLTYPGSGDNRERYPVFKNPFGGFNQVDGVTIPSGQPLESCLLCHDQFTGFSPGHEPAELGCYSCHGGNKFSMNAWQAHRGMRSIPGNMSDITLSCSSTACHPDILPRVSRSLMTSNSGLISVNRWVFGEIGSPSEPSHVNQVGHSAADSHLRNLCMACHLGRERNISGPITEHSRGGACLACHLNYDTAATQQRNKYYQSKGKIKELRSYVHPAININVGNGHCFGCHSRSGRISTNYEGWHETLLPLDSVKPYHRIVQNNRVFTPMPADVHHRAGMACIDCHSAMEVMGDGVQYLHKEEAVKISCKDCHNAGNSAKIGWNALDYETRKIIKIRRIDTASFFIAESATGRAVIGARTASSNGKALFYPRNATKALPLKAPAASCSFGKAHDNLSCSACHTAWASRCIGCHSQFDAKRQGNDLLAGTSTAGSWFELMGDFLAAPPTLGVVIDSKGAKVVKPVIPGMIMTLDLANYKSAKAESRSTFHRLFAVAEPHTTQREGRSCISCHNDPIALGYGGGELVYRIDNGTGHWTFSSEYAERSEDGLPADAWIGFLKTRTEKVATRTNVRPFDVEEQKRMLTVGACLTCHAGNSKVMKDAMLDFEASLKRVNRKCVLPVFP